MSDWKQLLLGDPTGWLLEEDNPSVRYLTLVDILGRPETVPEVKQARAAIMRTGVAPRVLAQQNPDGSWDRPDRPYHAKYRGTVWQLIILAGLLAEGDDERVRRGCEFVLERLQDRSSGGFAMNQAVRAGGGRHREVLPCLTGNLAWALLRFGYGGDPRVERAIGWLVRYQRFDDGVVDPPTGWPYDTYEMCWGRHTCHMGVVKALKALAEIPASEWSRGVRRTIDQSVEYLLRHHIHKRSHDLAKVSKPGWRRFGFPRMWQTDILEILGILTRLGYRDERMREAVDVVISKQDADGRWKLADTFNGKFLVDIEEKGAPSKWITLHALRVLKAWAT
ncbi:terpene cyclase/mutase family protein [Candidatus Fermentibacteria bacterium]|nr:terpene cyclase/mutase family protein [Candidatus Fermentibacteria bacterium]